MMKLKFKEVEVILLFPRKTLGKLSCYTNTWKYKIKYNLKNVFKCMNEIKSNIKEISRYLNQSKK